MRTIYELNFVIKLSIYVVCVAGNLENFEQVEFNPALPGDFDAF